MVVLFAGQGYSRFCSFDCRSGIFKTWQSCQLFRDIQGVVVLFAGQGYSRRSSFVSCSGIYLRCGSFVCRSGIIKVW